MKRLGTIELMGYSGNPFTFHTYIFEKPVWTLAAVYVLTHRHITRTGQVIHDKIYIGSTYNLSRDSLLQSNQACFKTHKLNTIGIYPTTILEDRETIKQDLIAMYQPPCIQ